jgi:hypothetical protein
VKVDEVVWATGPRDAFKRKPPTLEELEDRLAAAALGLATDMREDLGAAHRSVRAMDRLELEQVACVLAAMVDVNRSFASMAWWRTFPKFEGKAS